jgi:hypothetical protein
MADVSALPGCRWSVLYTASVRLRCGAQAIRLLAVMLRHCDEEAWRGSHEMLTWPCEAEITAESGLSSSSIFFGRQELVAAGIIAKAPGHKRGGCDPTAVFRIVREAKATPEARAAAKARRKRQKSRTERKHETERLRWGTPAIDGADAAAHAAGRKRPLHAADLNGDGEALPLVQPQT